MDVDVHNLENRVLFLAPTARDAEITQTLLGAAGMACVVCRGMSELAREVSIGAGAVLLTEAAIVAGEIGELSKALSYQPAWSDLPVVMLMTGGAQSAVAASRVHQSLRNVTLLERPAPTRSVLSAVQAAVRSRRRQYEIRDFVDRLRTADEQRRELLLSEQAARTEAERAGRMKDEFLATLSHELRTPLNAILGWSQILRTSHDEESLNEGLAVIERNARVQTQLIEDLLDMSRIISGKVRLDMKPLDPAEMVKAAVDSVHPSAKARGVILQTRLDPNAGSIVGDFGRLQQIVWNLLSNAVKFTPRGGTVNVLLQRTAALVLITVSDTGEGIKPEFLPHVFERFRQADASSTRRHGGLGLGLSIVKHLAEMHGGNVRVDSPGPGQGSTFVVSLPVNSANEADASARRRLATIPSKHEYPSADLKQLTVLVIDDENDARNMVRRILERNGAQVRTANSAASALEELAKLRPDVIVSDIAMPEQDGIDLLLLARKQGVVAPAIALTAFALAKDRERVLQAGFRTHLPKPVEPSDLLNAVLAAAREFRNKSMQA